MLLRRKRMPEDGEIVLCTVTRILHHSVFVDLDEFGRQGMIYISEIAPGRIRNLSDFVQEGKKVVCKVLRIDAQKGHIDLSLRRVNESQRRNKLDQIKHEQIAEKIIENLCTELKLDKLKVYSEIMQKIQDPYDFLYIFFFDFVVGKTSFEKFGITDKYVNRLSELVKERIKLPKVELLGDLVLKSYNPNGVELIKECIRIALSKGDDKTTIKYMGGGKYLLSVVAEDYGTAEHVLYNVTNAAIDYMIQNDSFGSFERKENKDKKEN